MTDAYEDTCAIGHCFRGIYEHGIKSILTAGPALSQIGATQVYKATDECEVQLNGNAYKVKIWPHLQTPLQSEVRRTI